jgi:translation initiation factor IF-3
MTNINRDIRAKEVRVISSEGEQLGIMLLEEALRIAEEYGLDLVEVAPNANPPVCRIMDYGKYRYQQTKKMKDAKKKQTVIQLKEVKLSPKTEEHDLQYKIQQEIG